MAVTPVSRKNKELVEAYRDVFILTPIEVNYYLSRLMDRTGWDRPATKEELLELFRVEFRNERDAAAQKAAHYRAQFNHQEARAQAFAQRERLLATLTSQASTN